MTIDLRFKYTQEDHILFIKHLEIGRVIALLIYIDDIIATKNNENE